MESKSVETRSYWASFFSNTISWGRSGLPVSSSSLGIANTTTIASKPFYVIILLFLLKDNPAINKMGDRASSHRKHFHGQSGQQTPWEKTYKRRSVRDSTVNS